jgi:hypothetical protein
MTSSDFPSSYALNLTQTATEDDVKVLFVHDHPQSIPVLRDTLRVLRAFYLHWNTKNPAEKIHTLIVMYVAAQKLSFGH